MRVSLTIVSLIVLSVASGFVEAAEPWEDAAAQRIEEHRKAPLAVRVVDADGNPIAGVKVHFAMQKHAFAWGTAVNAKLLATLPEDDPYKTWIPKLFNQATMNNYHKWKFQENPENREYAEKAVEWLDEHGLNVHGHTMIWASKKYRAMPDDVYAMLDSEHPDVDFLRRRSFEHIDTVGQRLRGKVVSWDVVNEPTEERFLQAAINPDAPSGREPILVEWYKAAKVAAPDVPLYINDYHILVGDFTEQKDSYEATIQYLLDQGAPLGGIGMQCHFYNGNLRRTPEQMLATLDRFGKFGLPIHLSEFDAFGGGWGTGFERRRKHAEFMRELMIVAFSHPNVAAFTVWNFWDGRHWADEAPFFRKNWSPKAALAAYMDLVFNQWWTDEVRRTDDDGAAEVRGFLGDYEIEVSAKGYTEDKRSFELGKDGVELTIELTAAKE